MTLVLNVPPDMRSHAGSIEAGEYAPPEWSAAPTVVLDIGANIGLATAYFRRLWPDVPIVCFEPCSGNFALLLQNVADLGDVRCIQAALGDRDAEAPLYLGVNNRGECSLARGFEQRDNSEMVQVRSARRAFERVPPGIFVKIDTEGHERPILEAAGDLILRADVVALEYHSEADRRWIDAHLGGLGYLLYGAHIQYPHRGTLRFVHRRTVPPGSYLARLGGDTTP